MIQKIVEIDKKYLFFTYIIEVEIVKLITNHKKHIILMFPINNYHYHKYSDPKSIKIVKKHQNI